LGDRVIHAARICIEQNAVRDAFADQLAKPMAGCEEQLGASVDHSQLTTVDP
jgi:hypothetical protein